MGLHKLKLSQLYLNKTQTNYAGTRTISLKKKYDVCNK